MITQNHHILHTVGVFEKGQKKENLATVINLDALHDPAPHIDPHPLNIHQDIAVLSLCIINLAQLLIPCPNKAFFNQVQTPRVLQSVLSAWDEIYAKSADVEQKTFGMAQNQDTERVTKEGSSHLLGTYYATTGIHIEAVLPPLMTKNTNALDVEERITVLKNVLKHRKRVPLTSYVRLQLANQC